MNTREKLKTYGALAAFILVLGVAGKVDSAQPAQPREVELSDARRAPSKLAYLKPGQYKTWAHGEAGFNCRRGYFTDTSAYHWDGSALAPQRWNRDRTLAYWRSVRGRVTFDGITFRNHTSQPVIVAGWCDN